MLAAPDVELAPLGPEWARLRQLCMDKQLSGNELPDAWLAAAVAHLEKHDSDQQEGRQHGRNEYAQLKAPTSTPSSINSVKALSEPGGSESSASPPQPRPSPASPPGGHIARQAQRCSLSVASALPPSRAHGRSAEWRPAETRKPSDNWAFDIACVGVRGGTKMGTGQPRWRPDPNPCHVRPFRAFHSIECIDVECCHRIHYLEMLLWPF